MPLLGEHPDLRGFWVAEAVWVTHSAASGRRSRSGWSTGEPGVDLHECDLNRFEEVQLTPSYVATRGAQNFVEVYDVLHPLDPPRSRARCASARSTPRQVELGAVFLEAAGWERPHWYEANAALPEVAACPAAATGRPATGRRSPAPRRWSPATGVAMYDMTPLKRLEVTGPGALALLQRLTTNNLDKKPGAVTYTLLLDAAGGVRSDLTVARLGEHRFQVGANGNLDLDWLRREAARPDVQIGDITGGTCCIGLWGPLARDLLAAVTRDDVSHEGFGYFRARERSTSATCR